MESENTVCHAYIKMSYLALNLSHRTLTGASTLTRRKKGRRRRASTAFSSHISVVTQRSLHRKVTNSRSDSTSANKWFSSFWGTSALGTWTLEADFSTEGVSALRERRMRVKPCSSMRYDAIEDFPAQMPATLLAVVLEKEAGSSPPQSPMSMLIGQQRQA